MGERDEPDGRVGCLKRQIVPNHRAALACARDAFRRVCKDRLRARPNRGDPAAGGVAETGPNRLRRKGTGLARTDVTIADPPA